MALRQSRFSNLFVRKATLFSFTSSQFSGKIRIYSRSIYVMNSVLKIVSDFCGLFDDRLVLICDMLTFVGISKISLKRNRIRDFHIRKNNYLIKTSESLRIN